MVSSYFLSQKLKLLVKNKILIIGLNGQDGKLLYEFYKSKKNTNIIGIDKKFIYYFEKKLIKKFNYLNEINIKKLIKLKFNKIFFLAAINQSSQNMDEHSSNYIKRSIHTNFLYYSNILSFVKEFSPKSKVIYATSSLIYSDKYVKVNENSEKDAKSIYSITKLSSYYLGKFYRDNLNIYVTNLILFNHDSHYRKDDFLIKKILNSAYSNYKGSSKKYVFFNKNTKIDISLAKVFINYFHQISNLRKPDDFILSSGRSYTIEQIIKNIYKNFNLNYQNHVIFKKKILPRKRAHIVGDNSKLKKYIKYYDLSLNEICSSLTKDYIDQF